MAKERRVVEKSPELAPEGTPVKVDGGLELSPEAVLQAPVAKPKQIAQDLPLVCPGAGTKVEPFGCNTCGMPCRVPVQAECKVCHQVFKVNIVKLDEGYLPDHPAKVGRKRDAQGRFE